MDLDKIKRNYIDAPWLLSETACVKALESIVEHEVHDSLRPDASDEDIRKKYRTRRSNILAQIRGAEEMAAALWGGTLNERASWFLILAQEKNKREGKEEVADEDLMEGFSYHASDLPWWETDAIRFEDVAFNYEGGFWSLVLARMGVYGFLNEDDKKAYTPEKRAAADRWLLDFTEDKPGVRDAFIREVRASQCEYHGWDGEEGDTP